MKYFPRKIVKMTSNEVFPGMISSKFPVFNLKNGSRIKLNFLCGAPKSHLVRCLRKM